MKHRWDDGVDWPGVVGLETGRKVAIDRDTLRTLLAVASVAVEYLYETGQEMPEGERARRAVANGERVAAT